jgi:site-specific DNA-methyltransferase (adenine-specific)
LSEIDTQSAAFHEIEFVASGQSAAGIEFYSWDFQYNPDNGFRASVIIEKEGNKFSLHLNRDAY